MKIISKFKDYYDYLIHQYGVDEKVVYVRKNFNEDGSPLKVEVNKNDAPFPLARNYYPYGSKDKKFDYQHVWLIVCGRYFPLIRKIPLDSFGSYVFPYVSYSKSLDDFHIINKDKDSELYSRFMNRRDYFTTYEITNEQYSHLIAISKKIKQPAFVITAVTYSTIEISPICPQLCKFGLDKVYAPDQLYQDLTYFIQNVLNESPDLMPAPKPPMTDKEKIVSHGFDLKQSFRNRK